MPQNAIYVGRPGRWGNPHRIGGPNPFSVDHPTIRTAEDAVVAFRRMFTSFSARYQEIELAPLRGKDLVCWCPLDQPCHADVLLELANG
jgi:hypothetical protein